MEDQKKKTAATQKTPAAKKPATPKPKAETTAEPVKHETTPVVDRTITIIIPEDPALQSDDQYWEYGINGITQRFRRGVPLELPADFAETVMAKLAKQKLIYENVKDFRNTSKKIADM